jgi:hypothetical protein
MSNPSWPANLCLDLLKSNWEEWSFHLKVQCDCLGFTWWLKGTLPQLDTILHPKAHYIWETNDCSLCSFIYRCILKVDYNVVSHLSTSQLIFDVLQQHHEKLSAHAKLLLLKKALNFCYGHDNPFCDGADEILAMHTRISNMGPVDLDQIKIILLLNAFGNNHEHLQSSLYAVMDSPAFGANTILCHLQQEDAINRLMWHSLGPTPQRLLLYAGTSHLGFARTARRKDTSPLTVLRQVVVWLARPWRRLTQPNAMLGGMAAMGIQPLSRCPPLARTW